MTNRLKQTITKDHHDRTVRKLKSEIIALQRANEKYNLEREILTKTTAEKKELEEKLEAVRQELQLMTQDRNSYSLQLQQVHKSVFCLQATIGDLERAIVYQAVQVANDEYRTSNGG